MQIDGDVITLLSMIIVAVMGFYLYRSVPKDVADKIMTKGEQVVAKTPQAWDDDAMRLVRALYDLLQTNRTTEAKTPEPLGEKPPAEG